MGIFWPGTFSLAALELPTAGTAMYAFMALAGDVGCSAGPTLVGLVANANQNNLQIGLLMALKELCKIIYFVCWLFLQYNNTGTSCNVANLACSTECVVLGSAKSYIFC